MYEAPHFLYIYTNLELLTALFGLDRLKTTKMKKILLFALLAILGYDSIYSQTKTKPGVKKASKTYSVQKKKVSKTTTAPKGGLSQEYFIKNVEGKPYAGTVRFSDYYPAYTIAYDVHALRTSQVLIFNFTKKYVTYAIMSAIDWDLVKNGDDRGSLILQNSLAEEHTRKSAKYTFQQEGNIFTFVEEFTKDGKAERINHKFRYDKQTNSFFDMDHNMTLKEYKE
jgi:hypothetical protein